MNRQAPVEHFESNGLLLDVFFDDETQSYGFRAEFKGEGVFERSPYVFESSLIAWDEGVYWIRRRRKGYLQNLAEFEELLAYTNRLDNSEKD